MSQEDWARYNCIDGAVTFKIHRDVQKDIEAQGYKKVYDDTMRLFPALIFMQTIGLDIDREALEKEKIQVEEDVQTSEKELRDICGFDLNVNSPKQCQQYFYGVLGFPPYTGKTGNVTTDDTAMARLVRKGCKEAGIVQRLRGLKKLKSTYLEVRTDRDGILRSSFNPRGTVTGRLSSSQTIFGTGFNFQNIDPRFKRFIRAHPGRVFISMDKAQAEWVITAYACGDPKMISAIENKEDIHARTIHEMTKVPLDLIAKDNKIVGKLTDSDEILQLRSKHLPELLNGSWNFLPKNMSLRQCGKKTNHGCNYLESARMFALINQIMEKDAGIYVNSYRDTYVMLPMWWDKIGAKLSKDRIIENMFGHRRRFLGKMDLDLKKAAVAHIPQSTSAWVVNYAMINCYNDDSDIFKDLWLHAQVHDELLFSYPVDRWNDLARVIHRIENYMTPLIEYEGREFSIGTDLAVGLYWAEKDEKCPQGIQKIKIEEDHKKLAEKLEELYRSIT